MDEQRRLLDELMGQERNLQEKDKSNRVRHFSDPDVCKYYLCGLSPYNLFKNTKSDLGAYDKVFDDECKAAYQALSPSEKDKYGYEYELMVLLERLVQGCDQRVKRHADRIRADHLAELDAMGQALTEAELQRMGEIEDEVAMLEGGSGDPASVLSLGVAGCVDEALAALSKCETMKREYAALEAKALSAAKDPLSGRKVLHMIVCDVSGNFMNSTDNGDRLRCHFEGKQYQGWKLIREKLKAYHKDLPPNPNRQDRDSSTARLGDSTANRLDRDRDRGDRERRRSRSRDRDPSSRSRRGDYDEYGGRSRRDDSRPRSDRRRSRSRSRDRRDRRR